MLSYSCLCFYKITSQPNNPNHNPHKREPEMKNTHTVIFTIAHERLNSTFCVDVPGMAPDASFITIVAQAVQQIERSGIRMTPESPYLPSIITKAALTHRWQPAKVLQAADTPKSVVGAMGTKEELLSKLKKRQTLPKDATHVSVGLTLSTIPMPTEIGKAEFKAKATIKKAGKATSGESRVAIEQLPGMHCIYPLLRVHNVQTEVCGHILTRDIRGRVLAQGKCEDLQIFIIYSVSGVFFVFIKPADEPYGILIEKNTPWEVVGNGFAGVTFSSVYDTLQTLVTKYTEVSLQGEDTDKLLRQLANTITDSH